MYFTAINYLFSETYKSRPKAKVIKELNFFNH